MKKGRFSDIDFDSWNLPKHYETGIPTDPVLPEEFERYEYWKAANGEPIRQIITKDGGDIYSDKLDVMTGQLYRGVIKWMGVDPYNDEKSEAEYYQLCQKLYLEYQNNENWHGLYLK